MENIWGNSLTVQIHVDTLTVPSPLPLRNHTNNKTLVCKFACILTKISTMVYNENSPVMDIIEYTGIYVYQSEHFVFLDNNA